MSDAIIDKLYGTPTTTDAPTPENDPQADIAAKFYDAPTKPYKPMPGSLYAFENLIESDLDRNLLALEERCGTSLADQAAERAAVYETMRASKLDEDLPTMRVLHTAWTHARLAAARPGGDPEAIARRDVLSEQTWNELREKHGEGVHALVDRVKSFAGKHPLITEMLTTGDVGSRRDVLDGLIEHVQRHNLGR